MTREAIVGASAGEGGATGREEEARWLAYDCDAQGRGSEGWRTRTALRCALLQPDGERAQGQPAYAAFCSRQELSSLSRGRWLADGRAKENE
eukprot:5857507-Prymnesium_polylepis.1